MGTRTDNENEKDKEEEKEGFIWYNEIRDLSEYACETVSQVCNDWSDYAGAMSPEDVGARYESRVPTYGDENARRISSDLEELKSVTFKINERLGNIETQTRKLSFLEDIRRLIIENTVGSIITTLTLAFLGYLGLNWLLG